MSAQLLSPTTLQFFKFQNFQWDNTNFTSSATRVSQTFAQLDQIIIPPPETTNIYTSVLCTITNPGSVSITDIIIAFFDTTPTINTLPGPSVKRPIYASKVVTAGPIAATSTFTTSLLTGPNVSSVAAALTESQAAIALSSPPNRFTGPLIGGVTPTNAESLLSTSMYMTMQMTTASDFFASGGSVNFDVNLYSIIFPYN